MTPPARSSLRAMLALACVLAVSCAVAVTTQGPYGRAAGTAASLEHGHRAGRRDPGQPAGQHRSGAHRAVLSVTEHSAAVTPAEQARAVRYWTAARMAGARPPVPPGTGTARDTGNAPASAAAQLPAVAPFHVPAAAPAGVARPRPAAILSNTAATGWPGGGAVGRTTGKVFFTMDAQDYVCSAAVVASPAADVVITAAHCVKNGTGSWAVNWTFVPGFAQGSRPYGSWTAHHFFVAPQWSRAANDNDDVAFVTLNPQHSGHRVSHIGKVVGGQPIKFGQRTAEEFAFGYPAEPPYNGGGLYYCSGRVTGDPFHASPDSGLRCQMTAGSSGGPWLSGFDPAHRSGTITSVSSFKYSADPSTLFAPPLGAVARSLFREAARG
jgi:Trypsin